MNFETIFDTFLNELQDKWCIEIDDWSYTQELATVSYPHYQKWIDEKKHGPLNYLMGERGEKRKNLLRYFTEAKSSLVFLISYSQFKFLLDRYYLMAARKNKFKMAAYALAFEGRDYHYLFPVILNDICSFLNQQIPDLRFAYSIDAMPVLERDLAYRSGLGWFGKNSMLINRSAGSYNLVLSLILNQNLPLLERRGRKLESDHCGTCTACISACPTDAIDSSERTLDAKKCISTFTIETFKNEKAPFGFDQSNGEIFGCDICQEVCPWNKRREKIFSSKKSIDRSMEQLKDQYPLLKFILNFFLERNPQEIIADLEKMSNRQFRKQFAGTALERTGRIGLLKNLTSHL